MRIGELADRAQVSQKAVRYCESMGLLSSMRLPNGYRDYDEGDVRVVEEIRQLTGLGIRVADTRPCVECLTRWASSRAIDCLGLGRHLPGCDHGARRAGRRTARDVGRGWRSCSCRRRQRVSCGCEAGA